MYPPPKWRRPHRLEKNEKEKGKKKQKNRKAKSTKKM